MVAPTEDMSTLKSLECVNVTSFGKRVFADVIKDLVTQTFWITQLGPKSNDKGLSRRQKRRCHRYAEEKGHVQMKADPEGCSR